MLKSQSVHVSNRFYQVFIKDHHTSKCSPGQAVKQFTSTCCLHFGKELLKLHLYMPEQRYSANERWKYFMINHNERVLHRPGIKPGSPDFKFNANRTCRFTTKCPDYNDYHTLHCRARFWRLFINSSLISCQRIYELN
jgi:hypothetical protein